MESTSHLLINLLVILISLLFIQYWMNQLYLSKLQTEIVLFISLTVAISFCMMFPFTINGGIIFDLRLIPFVLGCFYVHRITQIWMIVLIITLRLLHGVDHSLVAVISIIIFYFVIIKLKPVYQRLPIIGKISLSTLLVMFMSVSTLVGVKIFYHSPITWPFYLSYISIYTGGMFIVGYMVESIKQQHLVLRGLVRMEKMEVVSHLAASISHEIRNPLTTTRGFLQLLNESKDISAENKYYISIAIQELDQAEDIIRDYLTFAKPAPEKLENLNVQTEIEKAVRVVEPLAKMNAIEIFSSTESCSIIGNAGLFQQVLINTIKNGIEAMPLGGNLSIIGCVDKTNVTITITDEGVGMNDLQKNRLGEPYFSTKDSKGTGLGMMVVYRIVESMEGTIHVASKQGIGTKITFLFPISLNEYSLIKTSKKPV